MAEIRFSTTHQDALHTLHAGLFCSTEEAAEYGISSHSPNQAVDGEAIRLTSTNDTPGTCRRLYAVIARRHFRKFGVRLQDSTPITRFGFNPKSFVPDSISREQVKAWLDRDDIALYENDANRDKGYYLKSAGPAASFKVCGKTWREVALSLELI